jgi:cell division protein FtsI (penicillin-binding protein 3)
VAPKKAREARGDRQSGRGTRLRALFLGFLLLAGFAVVAVRAAQVQMFDRDRLTKISAQQTKREFEWAPRRGQINDRSGRPLAITEELDSFFVDPIAFELGFEKEGNRAEAVGALATALRLPRERVEKKLATQGHFVWLSRRVEKEITKAVTEVVTNLKVKGVVAVKEPKRTYPNHQLAGQVLGFVGEEAGQEGLERELESYLKGKELTAPALRDARGNLMLMQGAPDSSALYGASVTTTLDVAIQSFTEKALSAAVTEHHAAAGWAVVMDVQTGAILALAGAPSFDANKPGRDPAVWRNRAVQDVTEPGSTIKSFLIALALDQKVIKQKELFWCEKGAWRTFGRTIHDTHPVEWADPTAILTKSSNICAAKIGLRLGPERLAAGLRDFGFGEKSGIGLPSEGKGQVRDPARMAQIHTATMSFGQGMSATGVQTVAAMAAIANGGLLLKPYLVEKIVSHDGKVLLQRGREEVRRVLRPESARAVAVMLEENTHKGGSGTRAALTDFRVAGKTGTAQKVDPVRGGYGDKRLGSFLGFAPAGNPRIAILVAIDEPQGKTLGGEVAAPAWGQIASEALRQLGIVPPQRHEATVLREDRKKAAEAKARAAAWKAAAQAKAAAAKAAAESKAANPAPAQSPSAANGKPAHETMTVATAHGPAAEAAP